MCIIGTWGLHSMNIRVWGCRWSSKILITFIPCSKAKVRPINIPTRDQSLKIYICPYIIPEFENLYLSLYLMAEITTHPYTKGQKLRPILIPIGRNRDPSLYPSSKIATHQSGTSVLGIFFASEPPWELEPKHFSFQLCFTSDFSENRFILKLSVIQHSPPHRVFLMKKLQRCMKCRMISACC